MLLTSVIGDIPITPKSFRNMMYKRDFVEWQQIKMKMEGFNIEIGITHLLIYPLSSVKPYAIRKKDVIISNIILNMLKQLPPSVKFGSIKR